MPAAARSPISPLLPRLLLAIPLFGALACEVGMPESGSATLGEFSVDRYEFPNQRRAYPENNVSFTEAQEACDTVGKRLCTLWEWQLACMGEAHSRFPYGDDYDDSACHTAIAIQGHTSTGVAAGLSRAGAYSGCVSEAGVFDLSGNTEEWVDGYHLGERGILMGGAWYTYREYTDCTGNYSRSPMFRMRPKEKVFSAGFRCCEGPPVTEEDLKAFAEEQRIAETAQAKAAVPNPGGMVALDGYRMDALEYPNRVGVPPLVHVNWFEAHALCGDLGKRLCTADEWEGACRGAGGTRWPYGDTYDPAACNTEGLRPAPGGSFPECRGDAQIFDISGNVWEWTAERIDLGEDFGDDSDRRVVRGGAWYDRSSATSCEYSKGYFASNPNFGYRDVGFRCCQDLDAPSEFALADATPLPKPAVDSLAIIIDAGALADAGEAPGPSLEPGEIVAPNRPAAERVVVSQEGCPGDMVRVASVCIDFFEYPNKPGEIPRSSVSVEEAAELCRVQDRRLCTASEWRQACRGAEGNRWPYGNTYDRGACNYGFTGGKGGPSPAGSKADCVSDYGVFDLSGNVWEWVSTADAEGKIQFYGGYWNLGATYGKCNTVASADENFNHFSVGFRCCKDPNTHQPMDPRGPGAGPG